MASNSAIKKAKWRAKNKGAHLNSPVTRQRYPVEGPLGDMEIERFIDGEFVKLKIIAPPHHRSERNVLERKIALSGFIRKHWDNLTELLADDRVRSNYQVCQEVAEQIGALTIARRVDEIGPGKPQMMLIFFENDEDAMTALFTL